MPFPKLKSVMETPHQLDTIKTTLDIIAVILSIACVVIAVGIMVKGGRNAH